MVHICQKSLLVENQVVKKTTGEVFATAQRRRVQNFAVWIEKTAWTFSGEYIISGFLLEPARYPICAREL